MNTVKDFNRALQLWKKAAEKKGITSTMVGYFWFLQKQSKAKYCSAKYVLFCKWQ